MNMALNRISGETTARPVRETSRGNSPPPFTIDFFLVPGFDLLSLSAAIEPLRRANALMTGRPFEWRLVAWDRATVQASNKTDLTTETFNLAGKVADLTLVCADENPEHNIPNLLPDHLRRLWRRGHVVGAVGSGVFALAKGGILAGHRFALHWEHAALFSALWPSLQPKDEIFCIDRRIITCAGGFSAADLSLHHIDERVGAAVSRTAMELCLHPLKRSEGDRQSASVAARIGNRNPSLLRAIEWIEKNFLTTRDLELCCSTIGISQRQLQRLFKSNVGRSPTQYISELRLNHARVLLLETEMSVREIAQICGFDSTQLFSRKFRQNFGVSPFKFSHAHQKARASS